MQALRLGCAAVILAAMLGSLAYEGRRAEGRELLEDAQDGRLRSVVATHEEVRWRTDALRAFEADLPVYTDGRSYGQHELSGLLARYAPESDVRVEQRGWIRPRLLGSAAGVASLLTFLLLLGGPVPWRANRWGWFWLMGVGRETGVGALAFLLLSGRTPGLPTPRDPSRRLDGLQGFGVSILLSLLGVLLWLGIRQLIWPPTDGTASLVSPKA